MRRQRTQPTFAEILATTREEAAQVAWARATLAGKLRHLARRRDWHRTARRLSRLKLRALLRTIEIAPNRVNACRDLVRFPGLLSLGLRGCGRLHIQPGREGAVLRRLEEARA